MADIWSRPAAAPFSGVAGPAAPDAASPGAIWRRVLFVASVALILVYAQGWAAPLIGYGSTADLGQSALLRNAFLPIYGLSVLMVANRSGLEALARSPALMLLLGLCLLSTLWSIAPEMTLRRAVAILFTTLAGVGLAAQWRWATLAEILAAAFVIMGVSSAVMALLRPEWGVMSEIFPGAWRGLWPEKNALGEMMTFQVVFSAASAILAPKRAIWWLGCVAFGLAMILLSTSKTALLTSMVGLTAIALIWTARRSPALAVLAVWGAVTCAVVVALVLLIAPELVFGAIGKDLTFTGRTGIWLAAIRQLQEHGVLLGFGYGVFWERLDAWSPVEWVVHDTMFYAGHAHNGWLETALSLGVVGLAVWAIYFVETWVRAVRAFVSNAGAYVAIPYLLVFTLREVTEVSIIDYHDVAWVLFVTVAVKLALDRDAPQG